MTTTKTLSTLKKEAAIAPKYVIEVSEGFYLNEKGDNVTKDVSKALQYSVGFDNEEMKVGYWSAALSATVKVKYL